MFYLFWPGKPCQGNCQDLSPTGLRFMTEEALDSNDVIKIDAPSFQAVAEVTHQRCEDEDIVLMKSPVGYPARGVKTELLRKIESKTAPEVKCISNCVMPCHQGVEAKAVGYCIADRLADAAFGDLANGLYFSGSNGYRVDKIVSVQELMLELTTDDNS